MVLASCRHHSCDWTRSLEDGVEPEWGWRRLRYCDRNADSCRARSFLRSGCFYAVAVSWTGIGPTITRGPYPAGHTIFGGPVEFHMTLPYHSCFRAPCALQAHQGYAVLPFFRQRCNFTEHVVTLFCGRKQLRPSSVRRIGVDSSRCRHD